VPFKGKLFRKSPCPQILPLQRGGEKCTVNLRGKKRAADPNILLPRWEEAGRRGFSSGIFSFLGCTRDETEREIPPYYPERTARSFLILQEREGS